MTIKIRTILVAGLVVIGLLVILRIFLSHLSSRPVIQFNTSAGFSYGQFINNGASIIASEGDQCNLYIWNVNGQVERVLTKLCEVSNLNSLGQTLLLSNNTLLITEARSGDGDAAIFDLTNGELITQFRGPKITSGMDFDPIHNRIIAGGQNNTATIRDAVTGDVIQTLQGHDQAITDTDFSPDGNTALTASWDGTARVWDVASGINLQVLRGHTRPVLSVSVSPDGTQAVTASEDGSVRVWNLSDGREIWSVGPATPGPMRESARYSQSGLFIAAGDWLTGSVQILDVETGTLLDEFDTYGNYLHRGLAVSPDDQHVLTITDDGVFLTQIYPG